MANASLLKLWGLLFGSTDQNDASVEKILQNLRLGAGAPAIGIPFFWPRAAMPNTVMDEWADMVFLKANGASFSAATYPKLAKVWTGLIIPDMRGEFPRIWDDGRGVDSGRALLSVQGDAQQPITASFVARRVLSSTILLEPTGAFSSGNFSGSQLDSMAVSGASASNQRMIFDSSGVVRTASENRPRNIAFNFLVRAK